MGPRPQCYIPSHKVTGPLVLEKIFEGFLPYIGVVATLVMWPRPCEQTFVPPSHCGSIWNLALIDQVVLEKKIFENGGQRTDDEPWLYYKLTNESKGLGELKNPTCLPTSWTFPTKNKKKKKKKKENPDWPTYSLDIWVGNCKQTIF